MWTRLGKVFETVAIAYIIGAAISFGPVAFWAYTVKAENDQLYPMAQRLLKTNDYLFNGANSRGLLDICKDATGEMNVIFKEDCQK